MGTVQSTRTTSMEISSFEAKSSVSGRKNNDLVLAEPPTISTDLVQQDSEEGYEDSEEEYEDSDDDNDEEEEGRSWN
jgi:hypothetical protein